jgi:hypothetical protein
MVSWTARVIGVLESFVVIGGHSWSTRVRVIGVLESFMVIHGHGHSWS